uniref:Solute carrier family 25 member 51 n=1 Tax=Strigamia maritima TaxID=126957 RepID=T1JD17_STRMM
MIDNDPRTAKFLGLSTVNQRSFREFACGWGAAFINVIITFPINKVMFRQMLHGVGTHTAFDQIKIEGVSFVYRGILPPLLQKTFSISIMFGMYDKSCQLLNTNFPHLHPKICIATAGLFAGSVEALLTPLERIQTLLQDNKYHLRYKNTFHAILSLRQFGMREYFRGLTPILIRNGPSNMMFFGLRTEIRDLMPRTENMLGNFLEDFISGAIIGAIISTIFYPVNVVKTRMQVQVSGPFPSFLTVFWAIYNERDRSVRRLFYGVHLNYTRAILSWGIINAAYELLKKMMPIEDDSK